MYIIISFLVNAIAVVISSYVVPGVTVDTFTSAFAVAVVLGLLNAFVRPLLVLLTLPINILTLGLFTIIINMVILALADAVVPGFKLDGFISTLLFAVVLSVTSSLLGTLVLSEKK